MKNITLLMAFFAALTGFSQESRQKIQTYLDANRAKFDLTSQDVSDWVIESEVQGSGTGITSTYIVQRYLGTEIFNAQNNVWMKNGEVLNMTANNFKSNIAGKVNATVPSMSVIQAIASAYNKIGVTKNATFAIAETLTNKSFKLTDGLSEEVISAKLVFQNMKDNKLKLAYAFQFYSPVNGNLLDLRVDALNGAILESNNLTISCNFGDHDHLKSVKKNDFSFENIAFANTSKTMVAAPGTPGQYRVIPYNYTSPNHSPFQLITTAGNLLACPNGWHNANSLTGVLAALKYTYTRGNNVFAQEDAAGNNASTNPYTDGTASLTFDFPYTNGISQIQQPTAYTNASTTNLFYMNNIMHDVWYQYGFTENSGNFQRNNYGRGTAAGVSNSGAGDAVKAESQDGYAQTTPTLNNANFATPNDGTSPRMQMFMWTAGAPPTEYITINSPPSLAGGKIAIQNGFFTTDKVAIPVAPNGITSDFALYNNNKTMPNYSGHSACQPATNPFDLAGKIVLVRRGGCFFKDKVKKAQDFGASAVIMMDSIPLQLDPTITIPAFNNGNVRMGSDVLVGITIPAVFVNKTIGDQLEAAVLAGTVNGKIETPADLYLYADGSFDNTIISHEYGHGISNKLIGGPANSSCMTNLEQMGEGWSDWFGLMMQLKTGDLGTTGIPVGTYVENSPNNGPGIRVYPYTTDMILNPSTLIRTNVPVDAGGGYKYTIGETWATVMWDLTWAYIGKYGYDADIYAGTGGNNKVMKLAIDALKLQACNTASMITSRDLLFAADQATTGGQDYCLIAGVFARRGMGLNASSGDVNVTTDQFEDFTPFPNGPNCVLAVNEFNDPSIFKISPNPASGSLNIKLGQYSGKLNIQFIDVNGRVIDNIIDENFDTQKTIDVSRFETGLYFVKVTAENINFTQKVLIK